jgi:hypothetical protein
MSKPPRSLFRLGAIALAAGAALPVQAFEIDTGNPDFKLRWDNTIKYSAAARLKERSPTLSRTVRGAGGVLIGENNFGQDDGNNNFDKGLVSSRFDLLSELDASYGAFGARVSFAAWYDSVYLRGTRNTSNSSNRRPASLAREFTPETREAMGRDTQLLDAFVHARIPLGERSATLRVGRHTLLWGESLFFGANGVAGGMAPVDLVKLQSVPGSTSKETALPTGKVSATVPLGESLTLGAYVPYEWEKTRLVPVGAYLSTSDTLGPGAERIIAGPNVFPREPDVEPRDSGQFGLSLRWNAESIDTQFGLYLTRYHALTPSNNWLDETAATPPQPIAYRWIYHEGIESLGFSASRTFSEWSVGAEVSWRRNAPLASLAQTRVIGTPVGANFNNSSDPGYAVGETLHAQVSWIASLGPNPLFQEASFAGEIAWNQRQKVSKNPGMLNDNATRSATALRVSFAPTYRQVISGLDLTPTIGGSYTWGKSSALGPGFGPDKGGDFSLGLRAVYLGEWFATLNWTTYHGPEGPTLGPTTPPKAQFKQALKDREFVSFSLSTSF